MHPLFETYYFDSLSLFPHICFILGWGWNAHGQLKMWKSWETKKKCLFVCMSLVDEWIVITLLYCCVDFDFSFVASSITLISCTFKDIQKHCVLPCHLIRKSRSQAAAHIRVSQNVMIEMMILMDGSSSLSISSLPFGRLHSTVRKADVNVQFQFGGILWKRGGKSTPKNICVNCHLKTGLLTLISAELLHPLLPLSSTTIQWAAKFQICKKCNNLL